MFEYARYIGNRAHANKLSVLPCREDVNNKSFAARCMRIRNQIPAEAVSSYNVEIFKAEHYVFLGDSLFETS